MSQAFEILRRLEALHINLFAAVIVAALIAAILEQRWRRRHTPLFSQTHLDVAPPSETPRTRKGAKR
jgi:hypothetical protein